MTQIITDKRLLILGALLNGIGILMITKGSSIGSQKDKTEIIDKINNFREEIDLVKGTVHESEPLKKIEVIENEFDKWAEDFIKDFESKQIAKRKTEILLNEKEVNLSRQWRHIYQYFLEVIQSTLLALNKKSSTTIEFTLPEIPKNLFNKEAESYVGRITFDDNNIWKIRLHIKKPYEKDDIPIIVIDLFRGEAARKYAETLTRSTTFLILILHLDKKNITPDKSIQNLYVGDLKSSYSIEPDKYKDEIKQLVRTLIEYQLITQ